MHSFAIQAATWPVTVTLPLWYGFFYLLGCLAQLSLTTLGLSIQQTIMSPFMSTLRQGRSSRESNYKVISALRFLICWAEVTNHAFLKIKKGGDWTRFTFLFHLSHPIIIINFCLLCMNVLELNLISWISKRLNPGSGYMTVLEFHFLYSILQIFHVVE